MIIKGKQAGNVRFWSQHLLRDDTNERAEIMEISGLLSDNLPDALCEMQAIAVQSRSQGNFMYSANINPQANEQLTPEQWQQAVDTLEKNLGLEGHQRVVVEHEKFGRVHRHVIWNRVDVDTLRVADIGGNYRIHEKTARELESRFDLTPTPTPENGQFREAAKELWEVIKEKTSGITREQVSLDLTTAWNQSENGKTFKAAIEEKGYILAQGDRRDFVAVDQAGKPHNVARRIEGVKIDDVRERFTDLDRDSLPTVKEATAQQREIYPTPEAVKTAKEEAAQRRLEEWQRSRPLSKVEEKISGLYNHAENPRTFAASLFQEGITIARVDAKGITQLEREFSDKVRWVDEDQSKAIYKPPKLQEGELVAIDKFNNVRKLNPYRLDMQGIEQALGDKVSSMSSARDFIAKDRAAEKKQNQELIDKKIETKRIKEHEGNHARELRQENKKAENSFIGKAAENPIGATVAAAKSIANEGVKGLSVIGANGVINGLADFVCGLLAGGSQNTPPTPPNQIDQIKAQRKAIAALENIHDSMERGEGLNASDIQNLTPTHLKNIQLKGDDYLRQLAESIERESYLRHMQGIERERER